jgi:hypothetical protein
MTQYAKVFRSMDRWLKKNTDLDEETRTHHVFNLYFVYCGLRPACLISLDRTGTLEQKFADAFGLTLKHGPYFDIPGRDFSYFVGPMYRNALEPYFRRLEELYDETARGEFPENKVQRERVRLIGSILGFPDDCLYASSSFAHKDNIMVRFTINEKKRYRLVLDEVFTYGCTIKQNFSTYAIRLMQTSRPYLDPLGFSLGYHVEFFRTE